MLCPPNFLLGLVLNIILTYKKVTIIAKAIPKMPNKFPFSDVSGDDSPRSAKINSTPEIKYNSAARLYVII